MNLSKINIFIILIWFLTISSLNTYAQTLDSSRWVTSDLVNEISFTKNTVLFKSARYKGNHPYMFINDTLSFSDVNPIPKIGLMEQSKFSYQFRMNKLSKDSILLLPINAGARRIVPQNQYIFLNANTTIDTSIKFNRLVFHSSTSGYNQQNILIEIDSVGNYYSTQKRKDIPNKGHLYGKLKEIQLASLVSMLQKSQIRKMQDWKESMFTSSHTPTRLFTLYYNDGQKLDLMMHETPLVMNDLLEYLINSNHSIALKESKDNHVFGW